ncbi:hypothetical protein FWD20_02195 [Candidatus Saccharibacteria bacterium]|nr:hypothetical protein [Candidatus Saccharibacteria bacterium]
MKKRRLLFLIVNLVAILVSAMSVFLPWWQGMRPSDVALADILPFGSWTIFGFSPSVVIAIFVAAAAILLGALLALKLIVLGGVLVNIATALLWFLKFDIGWQPGKFGYGIYLLAASILIAAFSLLIPKRRKKP